MISDKIEELVKLHLSMQGFQLDIGQRARVELRIDELKKEIDAYYDKRTKTQNGHR